MGPSRTNASKRDTAEDAKTRCDSDRPHAKSNPRHPPYLSKSHGAGIARDIGGCRLRASEDASGRSAETLAVRTEAAGGMLASQSVALAGSELYNLQAKALEEIKRACIAAQNAAGEAAQGCQHLARRGRGLAERRAVPPTPPLPSS